ncbi:TrmH family RNA methyltransferase [Parasphingopyxis marina]|uniref:RNA methyltransferase n=1 Tax=Parasphingopyxis marina TaxID=2761622 RepID=A0A842HZV4_9SPHN|nr:RNA methyltransferase [Parasphingopyxis marina]MBC2777909.1 RNA methyltransferase [Parasphingopyxis marina]
MPREITAFSNPLIKRARSLRDKKHRRREGLFLAEGLRILSEAEESGRLPSEIFFTEDSESHPRAKALIDATEQAGGEAIRTSRAILTKLSGKDNPQAVVGIYPEFDLSLDALDRDSAQIWLVAQALRDPGNLGTMLRTGDAVGAGGLILIDDCADPFSVEAVRASMGALFTLGLAAAPWTEFLAWLRAGKGQLIGTSLDTDLDYQEPRYEKPVFLLVGNESAGLPADYAAACDLLVKMPMMGKADSLNAAVATAVMAYEALNQFRR